MDDTVRNKSFKFGKKNLEARATLNGSTWQVHVFDGINQIVGSGYHVTISEVEAIQSATQIDFIYVLLQICHVETQEYRSDIFDFGKNLSALDRGSRMRVERDQIDKLFGSHGLRDDLATALLRAFAAAHECSLIGVWPSSATDALWFQRKA